MTSDTLHAALQDLSSEMRRYGNSAEHRLRKIVCFCSTSLVLHDHLDASDRPEAARLLSELADAYGLPKDCVLLELCESDKD